MEGSMIDLSKYRFDSAVDDLDTAKELLRTQKYKASVNRSYYAIFHALRAVTALDDFDSSKHSGIISFFNKNYVKNEIRKIKKTYFLLVYSVFSIIVSGFVSHFKNVFPTPRINFTLYTLTFFFSISNLFWCTEYD